MGNNTPHSIVFILSRSANDLLSIKHFFFFYFNYSYITYITDTENNLQYNYIYSYITYVFCFLQIRKLQCNTIFKAILVGEHLYISPLVV